MGGGEMLNRDETIERIRAALKKKTGKTWSVSGGRGTSWGWITVQAPPKRRVFHDPNPKWEVWDLKCEEPRYFERLPKEGETGWYTSDAERQEIASAFGLDSPVHFQGLMVSPEKYEFYVAAVEKGL